jgi:hypothetical protein
LMLNRCIWQVLEHASYSASNHWNTYASRRWR